MNWNELDFSFDLFIVINKKIKLKFFPLISSSTDSNRYIYIYNQDKLDF